jgi:hypothetical protein
VANFEGQVDARTGDGSISLMAALTQLRPERATITSCGGAGKFQLPERKR